MADVTLGETPDRIWAWSFCGLRKPNQVETVWVKKSRNIGTEYVRGDLHRSTVNQREKELADLRAEVERLRGWLTAITVVDRKPSPKDPSKQVMRLERMAICALEGQPLQVALSPRPADEEGA